MTPHPAVESTGWSTPSPSHSPSSRQGQIHPANRKRRRRHASASHAQSPGSPTTRTEKDYVTPPPRQDSIRRPSRCRSPSRRVSKSSRWVPLWTSFVRSSRESSRKERLFCLTSHWLTGQGGSSSRASSSWLSRSTQLGVSIPVRQGALSHPFARMPPYTRNRYRTRRCPLTPVPPNPVAIRSHTINPVANPASPPQRFLCRGSSASRSPSPIKLNESTVKKIANPGKTVSHHAP